MKVVLTILNEKREAYLLALIVILILALCTFISATVFASDKANTLHCKLVATAHFKDMTKTTHKSFTLQEVDATVLSFKLNEIAQRARAGGAEKGEITCKSEHANAVHVYELKF